MSSSSTARATPREGIALPIALAAIVAIGALITGVVFAATQEYRVGRNALSAQQTHNAAEVGLHSLLASWESRQADTLGMGKSVRLPDTTINGAMVQREYTRLAPTSYWLTATALTSGESVDRKSLKRLHTIIRIETPDFKIMGAITGRGLDSLAGSGKVSGIDTVPPGWDCPLAGSPGAGIVVGDSAANVTSAGTCTEQSGSGKTKTSNPYACVEGDPKVKDSTALVNDTSTFKDFGGFNYDSLARIADKTFTSEPGGTAFGLVRPSTLNGACDYSDANNWGDTLPNPATNPRGPCKSYYPVIHLKGDGGGEWLINGSGGGQGIIIADGNVKLAGSFQWTGLILTRGYFKIEGAGGNTPKVLGAVMAMNAVTGGVANSVKGDATIRFSRCAVSTIMAKRSRAMQIKYRAWADMSF